MNEISKKSKNIFVKVLPIIIAIIFVTGLYGLLKLSGLKAFVIVSDSMNPILNIDDVVLTSKCDVNTLQKGDIISFYVDINGDGKDEIVTHYFSSLEYIEDKVVIKTLNEKSNMEDYWNLSQDDIIGKSFIYFRKIGIMYLFVTSSIGKSALLSSAIIIALMIVALNLIKLFENRKLFNGEEIKYNEK